MSKVGRELYEKFFRGYTRKMWNLDPSELDASVTARVPTRTNCDNRYFTDTYQFMPLQGYTTMFSNMLAHPNIKVMLNTDYKEITDMIPYKEMIFTGPIDEFFDYCYGKLPYRSIDFKFETLNQCNFQATGTVNYPNEHDYTRITEFKFLTGQKHDKTSIVYEFPKEGGDPYYPIPRRENAELYRKYQKLADSLKNAHFTGRLATYKYYNMDQVVAQSLTLFKKLSQSGSVQSIHEPATEHSSVGMSTKKLIRERREIISPAPKVKIIVMKLYTRKMLIKRISGATDHDKTVVSHTEEAMILFREDSVENCTLPQSTDAGFKAHELFNQFTADVIKSKVAFRR